MEKAHQKKFTFGSNTVTGIMKIRQGTGMAYNRTDPDKGKALLLLNIFLIVSLAWLLPSCGSSSPEYYENQEWNFSLEYPNNWELNEDNRVANDFSLQVTKGLLRNSNAWIYLYVSLPQDSPPELETDMENYIEIVTRETHQSLEVIQISDVIDDGSYKMIWATVSVPTLSLAEDSPINQMGERTENVSQTINIYILRNSQGQDIVVEVYKGTDESLNAQADEIVKSIQFINE
ncbi:MAG: hypothetical protein ACE5EH_13105 [Gammaproteobacteria bacterium]